MSYIVTAASGQLGALVVESLLARGAEPSTIVATSRDVSKLATFAERGVQTAPLDFTKPETISAVIGEGDVVVLVSSDAVGQRVAQHTAVIDAAKAAGAARIVYTSVLAASTSPLILAPEHKATEEHLAASGVPVTLLRNGWYTENYVGEIATARDAGVVAASVGRGRVASASRRDYAEAAAVAALDESTAGRTFELSGDHAWDFDEFAEALTTVTGRPVRYESLTPEQHAERLRGFGLDEGTVGFVVALDGNIREGLLADTSGDLSGLIGRPTTPLVEALSAASA
jgi:NAD(P)H dehydrogenase (quinone)